MLIRFYLLLLIECEGPVSSSGRIVCIDYRDSHPVCVASRYLSASGCTDSAGRSFRRFARIDLA